MASSSRERFPPPPHDPRERVPLADLGAWQVLQFPREDPKLAYFTTRGFLHLQLWHAGARLSILTPSRLTAGRFETWRAGGPRTSAAEWSELAAQVADVTLPVAAQVRALERWMVSRHEPAQLRLLRTWWRGAAPPAHRGRGA